MADKRINDHIKTTTAANVDEFIIDSDANGTRNITYANLQTQVKQYVLGDMDEVPTQNSNNPVKSGGIFSTMAVPKYNSSTETEYFEGGGAFSGNIDSVPTANSNNVVASGGTWSWTNDKLKRNNNIEIIDENFEIRFIGYSDVANRVLCPIVLPFAFASNDYTLECSLIDLASVGRFTTGITVNAKDRSSALIILSKTSSAGATYCGVASIHIYRSNT